MESSPNRVQLDHEEVFVRRDDARAAATGGKSPGAGAIEAFDLFRTYLDSQLKDLKKDLSFQTNKFKELSKKPTFNKESNRVQFEFNNEILEGLEVVLSKSDDDAVCGFIKDLVAKVRHRNKLLQIADSSPGGWSTVREYEKPVLCSDSEDEKRLRRAESRAVKKLKGNSSRPSRTPFYSPDNSFSRSTRHPFATTTYAKSEPLPSSHPVSDVNRPFRPFRRAATARDVCFACGLQGHFRSGCPVWSARAMQSTSDRKPSDVNGAAAYK